MKIGDKVLYGANGVMTIVDIREESVADVCRNYYVLSSALGKNESLTFVPADNEKLSGLMYPLMSESEIYSLLHRAKSITPMDWIKENRARQDAFKRVTESGDREKMVAMILAIEENAARRESEGKKSFLTDENAKLKAKRLLYSEIAVVLNIPEEEVGALIDRETK